MQYSYEKNTCLYEKINRENNENIIVFPFSGWRETYRLSKVLSNRRISLITLVDNTSAVRIRFIVLFGRRFCRTGCSRRRLLSQAAVRRGKGREDLWDGQYLVPDEIYWFIDSPSFFLYRRSVEKIWVFFSFFFFNALEYARHNNTYKPCVCNNTFFSFVWSSFVCFQSVCGRRPHITLLYHT